MQLCTQGYGYSGVDAVMSGGPNVVPLGGMFVLRTRTCAPGCGICAASLLMIPAQFSGMGRGGSTEYCIYLHDDPADISSTNSIHFIVLEVEVEVLDCKWEEGGRCGRVSREK